MQRFILFKRTVISLAVLGTVGVGIWFLTRPGPLTHPAPQFDPQLYGLWIPVHAEIQAAADREARILRGTEERSYVYRLYLPKPALSIERERGYLYRYFKDSGLTTRRSGRLKWYTLPDGALYITHIGDHGELDYRKARYEVHGDRLRIVGLPEEMSRIDTEYVRATTVEASMIRANRRKIAGP